MNDFISSLLYIVRSLPLTFLLMLFSLLLGVLLGGITAFVRLRRVPVLLQLSNVILSFLRGTPALIQLFLIYYGLPNLLLLVGIDLENWDKTVFCVIAFAFNCGAFLSEAFRSAYLAVPAEQTEAAYSVGMNQVQAFCRIVFPQFFALALPLMGNAVVTLLKETSLAFTIGVNDMIGRAQLYIQRNYGVGALAAYIAVALVYWGICVLMERCIRLLELFYKKGHAGLT